MAPLYVIGAASQCGDDGTDVSPPSACRAVISPELNSGAISAAERQMSPLNLTLLSVSLLLALGVVLVSAGIWAVASGQQNSQMSSVARRGVVAGALAAFFLGAMPQMIGFWLELGRKITP